MLFPYDPEDFWKQIREIIREEINELQQEKPHQIPGLPYKQLYKTEDICQLFQVSKPTINAWNKTGILKPFRLGRKVFFKHNDIQELLQNQFQKNGRSHIHPKKNTLKNYMPKKVIVKQVYKPSTKRKFFIAFPICRAGALYWLKEKDAPGRDITLRWALDRNFCVREENFTIKKMAKDFGVEPVKVTKWISDIYSGILDLNGEQPELFRTEGTKHELHAKFFNTNVYATVWLLKTPRIYEGFTFSFFRASVGTEWFYVEEVHHTMSKEEHSIRVQLTGGILNRYRDYLPAERS